MTLLPYSPRSQGLRSTEVPSSLAGCTRRGSLHSPSSPPGNYRRRAGPFPYLETVTCLDYAAAGGWTNGGWTEAPLCGDPIEAPPLCGGWSLWIEAPPLWIEAPPLWIEVLPLWIEAPPFWSEAPLFLTEAPLFWTEAPPLWTEAPPFCGGRT